MKDIVRCSSCGKTQPEVKKLIAAPTFLICDECIARCIDTLRKEGIEMERPPGPRGSLYVERHAGQQLIAGDILLEVMKIKGSIVKIRIDAPKAVSVDRVEWLLERGTPLPDWWKNG